MKRISAALEAAGLTTVVEGGRRFETGLPVEFPTMRNTARAPKLGATYAQHLEPVGRYLLHQEDVTRQPPPGWVTGMVAFACPIVLWKTLREDYAGPGGWKARLSSVYGGKVRLALSRALRRDGYDGIVTVDVVRYGQHELISTSEMVVA